MGSSDLDACLLARFPGTRPPDWLRRWLDNGLGGVLLFAENITGPAQLRALTADLRAHNPEVLIAADVLLGRPGPDGACGRGGLPGRELRGEPSS